MRVGGAVRVNNPRRHDDVRGRDQQRVGQGSIATLWVLEGRGAKSELPTSWDVVLYHQDEHMKA